MRTRLTVGRRPVWGLALALAVLGSTLFAPSALAVRSDCPAQYICLWDGPTYGSARAQFHDNGWQNLTNFGFNDVTSSYWNNTNRWAKLAEHINAGGMQICIAPGQYGTFATGGFPNWDNIASSVWLGTTGC